MLKMWRCLPQKLIGQGHKQAQLFPSVMILEVPITTYKENILYYLVQLCLPQNIRLDQCASLHFSMILCFRFILCWEMSIKSKGSSCCLHLQWIMLSFLRNTEIFSYVLLFFGSILLPAYYGDEPYYRWTVLRTTET